MPFEHVRSPSVCSGRQIGPGEAEYERDARSLLQFLVHDIPSGTYEELLRLMVAWEASAGLPLGRMQKVFKEAVLIFNQTEEPNA